MRKYRVTYTVTMMIGTFVDEVESPTSDNKDLRKALNKKIADEGIKTNGKHPKVREILLVETLKDGDVAESL